MSQTIMSESRFNSYIKSILRNASMKWPAINSARTKARVERGLYKCNICNKIVPASKIMTLKNGKTKRVKNVVVDHIDPVVPTTGFTTWDDVIDRLFIDEEGLQVLCKECHDAKCRREIEERQLQRL